MHHFRVVPLMVSIIVARRIFCFYIYFDAKSMKRDLIIVFVLINKDVTTLSLGLFGL